MNDVQSLDSFPDLLRHDGVVEELELRSAVGVLALHGGGLERTTDVIAREVAGRAGASLYAVVQPPYSRIHVTSARMKRSDSPALDQFLGHVDVGLSIHGYGRDDRFRTVLVGGSNRPLAERIGQAMRHALDDSFEIVDDLDHIPRGLRGLHPDNPVNQPAGGGVHVELPPAIRWNREAWNWSDFEGTPRTEAVSTLIDALASELGSWPPDSVGIGSGATG